MEDMFCPQDEPINCMATYTISQDDMDAGSRSTASYASSHSPNGTNILDETNNIADLEGVASVLVGEHYYFVVS